MKPLQLTKTAYQMAKALLKDRSLPLFVSWALSNRCNQKCQYCDVWCTREKELTEENRIRLLEELATAGCRIVSFTGGEPLLQDDLGNLIDKAQDLGISPRVNTNGTLLEDPEVLENADQVVISLDGHCEQHDAQRGEGTFKDTLRGIEVATEAGLNVVLTTLLTDKPVKAVDEALELAEQFDIPVHFQIAMQEKLMSGKPNPLSPKPDRYHKAINRLKKLKKEKHPLIANSKTALKHMAHWPQKRSIKCYAGRFYFRISASGDIYPCDWGLPKEEQDVLKWEPGKLDTILENMPSVGCSQCWFSRPVEVNKALSGNLGALRDIASQLLN